MNSRTFRIKESQGVTSLTSNLKSPYRLKKLLYRKVLEMTLTRLPPSNKTHDVVLNLRETQKQAAAQKGTKMRHVWEWRPSLTRGAFNNPSARAQEPPFGGWRFAWRYGVQVCLSAASSCQPRHRWRADLGVSAIHCA